eukprot:TRINITY_DN65842_c6_g6_i1.p2 TRINITY_DN65842_c6_g6~~TRINITY_DN65842_c6_g6_i1.p2  ORF type:complete len:169 (-),score=63.24 TRINITY_DN65842_c6_g6_i1:56-562(-)
MLTIKCADLAHCIRPFAVAEPWEDLIQQEFFAQGDLERQLGLPIGPCNDRETVNIPNSQVFFYNHLARPLFDTAAQMLPEVRDAWIGTLDANVAIWAARAKQRSQSPSQREAASERKRGDSGSDGADDHQDSDLDDDPSMPVAQRIARLSRQSSGSSSRDSLIEFTVT